MEKRLPYSRGDSMYSHFGFSLNSCVFLRFAWLFLSCNLLINLGASSASTDFDEALKLREEERIDWVVNKLLEYSSHLKKSTFSIRVREQGKDRLNFYCRNSSFSIVGTHRFL